MIWQLVTLEQQDISQGFDGTASCYRGLYRYKLKLFV